MAGPWEEYQSAKPVAGDGPWSEYAQKPQRGAVDKLLGLTGERYQTWPERAIREMVSVPEKVITAAASAEPGTRELTENLVPASTEAALLASPLKPGVQKTLAKPGPAPIPTAAELKEAGSAGYKQARELGVDIKAESVAGMAQSLGAKLEKDGLNAKLAPETFSVISELAAPPAGSVFTIANLETARATLSNAAKNFTNPREKLAADRAIRHLDDYAANINAADVLAGDAKAASRILSDARGNYAASKRSERLTEETERADRSADAANSGMNLGNRIRQRYDTILNSDKKSNGFNEAELAQIEKTVRGTTPGNAMRFAGNLMGGGGGLGAVVSAMAGAAVNPVLAAAPVVGYGLKKLSDASVSRQARIADEMTRSRSPLAQSRPAVEAPPSVNDERIARIVRALMTNQMQAGQQMTVPSIYDWQK